MNEKPLFIPLKAEFFDAFASGAKTTEYRKRSDRWNAETCAIGRRVVLARGYGFPRLTGTVAAFRYNKTPILLPGWQQCYGSGPAVAACITITLDRR